MKSQQILCSVALLFAAASVQAQSFNVDIGSSNLSIPNSTYGAAAAQPGVWTRVSAVPAGPQALKDLSTGNLTAVTLTVTGGLGDFSFNNAGTALDDERLLDDAMDLGTSASTWTFSGLAAGNYQVYTYAWAPDDVSYRTNVAVTGAAEASQLVGGAWAGSHAQGLTYALHTRSIAAGGTIVVTTNTSIGFGAVNGFQIYKVPDVGPIQAFCFGDGSSTLCPCGNFGGTGRGCDNSAGTGGALLSATGQLANDTIVFSSSGELPTALTIFMQGTANQAPAAIFGDGVRCTGGTLKRLYVKPAVAGVATAPGVGDLSVRAQSAALGDVIPAGATRYYQAYYRDADPNFCPGPTGNTFNISSGLQILWP